MFWAPMPKAAVYKDDEPWARRGTEEWPLGDVKKDETGPDIEDAQFLGQGLEPAMQDMEHHDLAGLIPEKEWVSIDHGLEPISFDRGQREAYLMWRTLVNALEER